MTWRDSIAPVIAEIIERVGKSDMKALRKALRDGRTDFVRNTSWGKKVWYSEVAAQLGIRKHRIAVKARVIDRCRGQLFLKMED
jgi:hypothetical protein